METSNELFSEVLGRYPDCPTLPPLPVGASKWGEADFELFVSSMGLITPQDADSEEQVSPIAAGERQTGTLDVRGFGTSTACLVIPSTIYMEDRAPAGLKMDSILTKFDRCRAAALQSISGVNLRVMAEDYGVGILLSDLAVLVEAEKQPALNSVADVESEIDLPKMPLVPSRQRLVGTSGEVLCSATFGQLLVDLSTTRLSDNKDAYGRIKAPCDRAFGRDVPNTKTLAVRRELSDILARQQPARGHMFAPTEYLRGRYIVAPSDCDMYDTVYHPKVASISEHACLSAGKKFCCEGCTAFFSRFISPLPPGMQLAVHIFVEATVHLGTRALFVFEEEEKDGAVVLCTFAVYGGPLPGTLYREEVQAASQKVGQALVKGARTGQWNASRTACDLSALQPVAVAAG